MRIQYLSASGELGGAEMCLLDMMASLKTAQPDWQIGLISGQDGPLMERARALGVPATVLPFPGTVARLGDSKAGNGGPSSLLLAAKLAASSVAAANYCRQLRQQIRGFNPDILHGNSLKMNVLGAWARDPGVPMVWHLHDYIGSRSFMSRAMRGSRRRCSAMLANSNSVRDDACAVFPGFTGIHTLYNAIDLAEFSPHGPAVDLDHLSHLEPAPPGTVRVGLIATMAWWKGHREFIQALALLGDRESVRGYIIGGPLYQSQGSQTDLDGLRALAAECKLRVGFPGFVADPASAMRALDIVVHASTRPEPFGRVIIEAMACGKPVITAGLGGAAELVTDRKNALVFRGGGPSDLVKQIHLLTHDQSLRQRLGAAGREAVMQNFDRKRLGPQLASIYQQIAGRTN
jgi:glycosyltransferase involved in cell wall biosynthesis